MSRRHVWLCAATTFSIIFGSVNAFSYLKYEPMIIKAETIEPKKSTVNIVLETMAESTEPQTESSTESQPTIYELTGLTEKEIDLIATVAMAEAEGEGEYGQRLVIDTILNRVDSNQFPNNVTDVIYQKGQFSCMWDGRFDKCYVMDDIKQFVIEEAIERQNYDVLFFRTKHYSKYGTPVFVVGNHYFSK